MSLLRPNPSNRRTDPRQEHIQRTRRSFLKALGTSALALPFCRMLENSVVHAATGEAHLNFVGLYHPHGVASPLFRRRAEDSEDLFELNFVEPLSGAKSVLAPFDDPTTYGRSFKDRVIVLDGLDITTGLAGHDAPPSLFTGAGLGGSGPSIDQFLAVTHKLGADTPFSSLALGVGSTGHEKDTIAYNEAGAALPRIIDPAETFATVFSSLLAGDDAEKRKALEERRARGASVIDFVRADIERLRTRLAAPEAAKLDQHVASLRDIEKQLKGFEGTCSLPGAPPMFEKLERYNGGEKNFEQITNLQVDMLAQAIVCDLTRFATLWMADLSAGAIAGTGISHPTYTESVDVHNSVAHRYSPLSEMAPGDPTSWAVCGVQERYSYSKAARLLSKLAEGEALDTTLVMMTTDMGDTSRHSSQNVPMLLAGGAGGKLKMGRHIRLKENCPPGNFYCTDPTTFPHNRLLVSIANTFGVETQSFGSTKDPADAEGELSVLQA